MAREMLKKKLQAGGEQIKEMLEEGTEATLSMHGDDGYPYGLPLNYVYLNDTIYMHTANGGYKIEALKANNKVCFSAITYSEIAPELFTNRYESVIATGEIEFVEDEVEKTKVMEAFVKRFSPGLEEGRQKFIKAALGRTAILKLNVDDIKGRTFRR